MNQSTVDVLLECIDRLDRLTITQIKTFNEMDIKILKELRDKIIERLDDNSALGGISTLL
jgi:hypothetical protein